MLISEKERLMLFEKKDKIPQITSEIITNLNISPDKTFIINKINEVVSILSTISSYSDSKSHILLALYDYSSHLTQSLEILENEEVSHRRVFINHWCTLVNSIEFKFTEKKTLIQVPSFDLNIFKQSLSGFKTGLEIK